jgi:hypothetical protein
LTKYLNCWDSFAIKAVPANVSIASGHYKNHEQTWRNAVAIEWLLFGNLDTIFNGFVPSFFSIESRPETSRTLLVHLGSRRNTINSHEEQLFGLNLPKQMFDVIEYTYKHFFLAQAEGHILACILVGTVMNDTIHIELADGQCEVAA